MEKIVISTGNENKIREIKEIFKGLNFEIYSKKELGLGDLEVVEDGDSLEANAYLKARALKDKLDTYVLADDSGLFVEALNFQPGIYSSRYSGIEGDDKGNNLKLLRELEGEENRSAYFEAAIVVITPKGDKLVASARSYGDILEEEKGQGGFGYDPLFQPRGYDRSFGEMTSEEKNLISHRKLALEKIRLELENYIKEDK